MQENSGDNLSLISLEWFWKDGSRREWKLRATPSGMTENPEGDIVWYWYLYDENAISINVASSYIWSGSLVGQGSHPPKLDAFLLNWLEDVNRVVVDGACSVSLTESHGVSRGAKKHT